MPVSPIGRRTPVDRHFDFVDVALHARKLALDVAQSGALLHPELFDSAVNAAQNSAKAPGSKNRSFRARSARPSSSCRLMLCAFVHVDLAMKAWHRSVSRLDRMNPAPHTPHFVRPENK